MTRPAFFQPVDGWVGDVIPAVAAGGDAVELYYLHDRRDPALGMPWHLATTSDFVTFTDRGEALSSGGSDAADLNAYTGCVVDGPDGCRHLFYTGQHPARLGADGRPLQLVMHATGDGTGGWVKHPGHTFGAGEGYETGDWRDPFVIRDDEHGVWRMLLAARHDKGPERRRGVIAQCVSRDLVHWESAEPFWDPRRFVTHECPDVFRWGDWWYLVFSEFSDSFATRYRMARTLDGPWLVPHHDTIDGRSFYAAKSVSYDGRRYLVGWIATREGDSDDGPWQWAGTMATLQLAQNADGTLRFALPDTLLASFDRPGQAGVPLTTLHAPDGYAAVVGSAPLPRQGLLRVTLEIAAGTTECGLLLRATDDGDQAHAIRLEPKRNRLVQDRWPRRRTGGEQWQISGDVPHLIETERPVALPAGAHTLDVVFDGSAVQVCIDDSVTLSTRMYDERGDRVGIFVGEGTVTITDFQLYERN
ncbi:glycoside hydrolase [Flexivirga sp. ID2601S]|uniref:beta-fructofuranosidase n=1 Tax=Flexivirga aerilata TaxID=1656889 RepID=A0A849AIY7_9MICO|nr:GH32 C-terminal domain-containing protein [Flexivirga aerilata]NNG40395.1 glycoside hydrolase [Flexivirga aerilata]